MLLESLNHDENPEYLGLLEFSGKPLRSFKLGLRLNFIFSNQILTKSGAVKKVKVPQNGNTQVPLKVYFP